MKRKLHAQISARIEAPEAIVVTGMRRVGKTTLLRQIYNDIPSKNKLFLDLENPVYQKYFEVENYESIRYQLETLGVHTKERAYIFLDEIQSVRNMPSIVKYLGDHYAYKFFLTGSSSFYLKNLFSESLSGRKIIYELYPLDFEEFLRLKESRVCVPAIGACTKPLYDTIIPLYREYIEFGGFPGVVKKETLEEKREALREIFTAYFQKEVQALSGFRNNALVRDLILLLSTRIGSKMDKQKLSSELGINRTTLQEYIDFLEGTYIISLLSPYSRGRDIEVRGAKKVYMCDSGLANMLGKVEFGHLFENAVHHQLRLRNQTLRYYQRKSGVELDFIDHELRGWEVKTRATTTETHKVKKLVKELSLKEGGVISFEWVGEEYIYGFQI